MEKIISRTFAHKLIREGNATYLGGNPRDSLSTCNAAGDAYVLIERWDCQRIDRYRATLADFRRK
jgi:hypothetical protein